jgi:hypothetical protein
VNWLMVVDAEVASAVEREWNEWYDTEHLPSILGCPYFLRAHRYRSGSHRYLTIYEVSGPECMQSQEFARRRGWGRFADSVSARVELYELIGQSGPDHAAEPG